MDCLNNRIGIKGCGAFTAEAVVGPPAVPALPILLVNDLPGVTLENIEAMVNDEQQTFIGLWDSVSFRAMKKFDILFKAKLNKCYKITDKVVIECLVCESKELFDVALWYLHGVELMIERTSTDEMSRYTTIDLEKAEKLKEEFYLEFDAALTDAVNSMNPADSPCTVDECIECNDQVKFVFQTP